MFDQNPVTDCHLSNGKVRQKIKVLLCTAADKNVSEFIWNPDKSNQFCTMGTTIEKYPDCGQVFTQAEIFGMLIKT